MLGPEPVKCAYSIDEALRIIEPVRADRKEMIVLHPKRGLRLAETHQGPRHKRVDFAIADIIVSRDAYEIAARMQRRPQRGIGETFVIAAIVRRRQIQRGNRARTEG